MIRVLPPNVDVSPEHVEAFKRQVEKFGLGLDQTKVTWQRIPMGWLKITTESSGTLTFSGLQPGSTLVYDTQRGIHREVKSYVSEKCQTPKNPSLFQRLLKFLNGYGKGES